MQPSPGSIAWIIDEASPREKLAYFSRTIAFLKPYFQIFPLKAKINQEAQVLEKLQNGGFAFVLAPYSFYQSWHKVEGLFGINRTRGPGFAGYLTDPLPADAQMDTGGGLRRIVLNLHQLVPQEILLLLRSMIDEKKRSGLRPLLEGNAPIYCENWYGSLGLGYRIDHVLGLPEIRDSEWTKRFGALRILLTAAWSLVYEEGPGKATSPTPGASQHPKAYFQMGATQGCLAFRLYFHSGSHSSPKEIMRQFSVDKDNPTLGSQLLLRHADFLRVHTIPESSDLEITAGLLPSKPAEKFTDQTHTIWIEPLSSMTIVELPYVAPGPQSPDLRPLPSSPVTPEAKLRAVETPRTGPSEKMQKQMIRDATAKIKELKTIIKSQDDRIHDMKVGGIGSPRPIPPPDAESLLIAFQERYFDAKYQLREFERQIADLESRGASPVEIETLRLKMDALANREKAWIRKLMDTLASYRNSIRKPK